MAWSWEGGEVAMFHSAVRCLLHRSHQRNNSPRQTDGQVHRAVQFISVYSSQSMCTSMFGGGGRGVGLEWAAGCLNHRRMWESGHISASKRKLFSGSVKAKGSRLMGGVALL